VQRNKSKERGTFVRGTIGKRRDHFSRQKYLSGENLIAKEMGVGKGGGTEENKPLNDQGRQYVLKIKEQRETVTFGKKKGGAIYGWGVDNRSRRKIVTRHHRPDSRHIGVYCMETRLNGGGGVTFQGRKKKIRCHSRSRGERKSTSSG